MEYTHTHIDCHCGALCASFTMHSSIEQLKADDTFATTRWRSLTQQDTITIKDSPNNEHCINFLYQSNDNDSKNYMYRYSVQIIRLKKMPQFKYSVFMLT